MSDLRDDITFIVERVWAGDSRYWRERGDDFIGYELDIEAVVDDLMAAVDGHDGEVLEVFGDA